MDNKKTLLKIEVDDQGESSFYIDLNSNLDRNTLVSSIWNAMAERHDLEHLFTHIIGYYHLHRSEIKKRIKEGETAEMLKLNKNEYKS